MSKTVAFCNDYCCLGPTKCSFLGEFAINYSKYHKICKHHLPEISSRSTLICGYCTSTLKISPSCIEQIFSTFSEKKFLSMNHLKLHHIPDYHLNSSMCKNSLQNKAKVLEIPKNQPKGLDFSENNPKSCNFQPHSNKSSLSKISTSQFIINEPAFEHTSAINEAHSDFYQSEEEIGKSLSLSVQVEKNEDFSETQVRKGSQLGFWIKFDYIKYSFNDGVLIWSELHQIDGECFRCGCEIYKSDENALDYEKTGIKNSFKNKIIKSRTGEIFKKCFSCNEKAQILAILPCFHSACSNCIRTGCKSCNPDSIKSICKICNNKKIMCLDLLEPSDVSQPTRTISCFECINSKYSNFPSCQSCKSPSENLKVLHCKHRLCSNCQDSCQLCGLINKPNCLMSKTLSCNHRVCCECFKLNPSCFFCNTHSSSRSYCESKKIASFFGNCKKCDQLLCSFCDKSHFPTNDLCDYCLKKNMDHVLTCTEKICRNHQFCSDCHPSSDFACIICFPVDSKCFTCLRTGQIKKFFKCGHLGCAGCLKNIYCFGCIFNKNRMIPKLNVKKKCTLCNKKSFEKILTLICNHDMCEKCIKNQIKLKLFNYTCIECLSNEKNQQCKEGLKPLQIVKSGNKTTNICCKNLS